MRTFVGVAALAVCAAGAPNEQKFQEFLVRHNKSYSSREEFATKYAVFVENLKDIAAHQEAGGGEAVYSHLSPFADITPQEFSRSHGLRFPAGFDRGSLKMAPRLDVGDLPVSFDWRDKGAVNNMKNQKACGSCWAFAAVANIEGAAFVTTGKLVSLSEQQLVDCDKGGGDEGCDGGLPSQAYQYLIDHKTGLETEEDYPYRARDGKCKAEASKEVAFVGSWQAISTDEDQIAASLMQYGPLAIGINAAFMQFYSGGIAKYERCNPNHLDHGVAIVGFGHGGVQGSDYWIIRNSWGPRWGEEGYYRIVRGFGMCGMNTLVTTATEVSLRAMSQETSIVV